jgi:type IV secretion system protein VirB1
VILPLAVFTQLAASCGPTVHVDTLAVIARTESGFHTGAINDNTDKRRYLPRTREEAIAIATDLVTVKHHSVDLGLMQVNSANLPSLGMTVADAFDPCKSIAAGARVLVAAYRPPPTGQDAQPALLQALSRYNTGHPVRGFTNGYVRTVQASAEQIVPAIRVGGSAGSGQAEGEGIASAPPRPPPSWDVYGQARYTREQGGLVFGGSQPAQAPAPAPGAPQPPAQPVQLKAVSRVADDR